MEEEEEKEEEEDQYYLGEKLAAPDTKDISTFSLVKNYLMKN